MSEAKSPSDEFMRLSNIDRVMPAGFLYLLLKLINYPDEPKLSVPGSEIVTTPFAQNHPTATVRLLIALARDTGLDLNVDEQTNAIRSVELPPEAVKAILATIEKYLIRFRKGNLIPIEMNYTGYGQIKVVLLEMIRDTVEASGSKAIILTNKRLSPSLRIFEGILLLEKEKCLKIIRIYNAVGTDDKAVYRIAVKSNMKRIREALFTESMNGNSSPRCITKEKRGYLVIPETNEELYISRASSRPYRLLATLSNPFGVAKKIDTVYTEISKGRKKEPPDTYLETGKMIQSIEYAKKELQKIKGFSKIVRIRIDKDRKNVWLERR
ncbi:MAG: hypothetical protein HGA33_00425 [Candidatus Moranbacteria bacterium]|nr:hypothetical protein [Candidatus Moranbacteria bacterium]